VPNIYISEIIMQLREPVAIRGDGLLLLNSWLEENIRLLKSAVEVQ